MTDHFAEYKACLRRMAVPYGAATNATSIAQYQLDKAMRELDVASKALDRVLSGNRGLGHGLTAR